MQTTTSSDQRSNTTPPAWFDRAIRQGIATLYALALDGVPAADTLSATVKLWVEDLWRRRCSVWTEADLPRLQAAFRKLRTDRRRWPQMVDFLEAVPDPQPSTAPALPARALSDADCEANARRIDEIIGAMTATPDPEPGLRRVRAPTLTPAQMEAIEAELREQKAQRKAQASAEAGGAQ